MSDCCFLYERGGIVTLINDHHVLKGVFGKMPFESLMRFWHRIIVALSTDDYDDDNNQYDSILKCARIPIDKFDISFGSARAMTN